MFASLYMMVRYYTIINELVNDMDLSYTQNRVMTMNNINSTPHPYFAIDFSDYSDESLLTSIETSDTSPTSTATDIPFELDGKAQLMEDTSHYFTALRIQSDKDKVIIPGVNISPSAMPKCTRIIGIKLGNDTNFNGLVLGKVNGKFEMKVEKYYFG